MTEGRQRRKTAGKRMTELVGKAQEDDDMFWGHNTWADGSDSGNESFRESDEDSALRKDVFDSDFNDSESDNEADEIAAAADAESTLRRSEKRRKRGGGGGGQYVDIAKAGRDLMAKKKGKGKRTMMGDGMNAGIVLNLPMPGVGSPVTGLTANAAAAAAASRQHKGTPGRLTPPVSQVQKGSQRHPAAATASAATKTSVKSKAKSKPKPVVISAKKLMRRKYKQEELLLEAVHETEPGNRRWLLSRKRVQDLADQDKDLLLSRDRTRAKIIQKYHSRRGRLITLTFPEMDYVPDVLSRSQEPPKKATQTLCAITGKVARYKDPLTGMGYVDIATFKELRRRYKQGLSLDKYGETMAQIKAEEEREKLKRERLETEKLRQQKEQEQLQEANLAEGKEDTDVPMTTASSSMTTAAAHKSDGTHGEIDAEKTASVNDLGPSSSLVTGDEDPTVPTVPEATSNPLQSDAPTTEVVPSSVAGENAQSQSAPVQSIKSDPSNEKTVKQEAETDGQNVDVKINVSKTTCADVAGDGMAAVLQTQEPSMAHSSSRTSTRRWKPSSKMLENIVNSTDELTSAVVDTSETPPVAMEVTAKDPGPQESKDDGTDADDDSSFEPDGKPSTEGQ